MEEHLVHWMAGFPAWVLFAVIAASLFVLAKGADILVDEAVALSLKWHIPKAVIGATIVSLGTTTPEAAVSVHAAIQGSPGLALGNAVGSIICDTGLILGIAVIIQPVKLDRQVVNRQGWIQFACGLLLVISCLPYGNLSRVFSEGGILPQRMGWVFLFLLAMYLAVSVHWSRKSGAGEVEESKEASASPVMVLLKLLLAIAVVVLSAQVLIPAVREAAFRLHVPEGVIAATLVAFGTSLPELVTAVTAALKGHGQLGVGNVIGADILNVLFVAGAAAAVTPGGLTAPPEFFRVLFPALLLILAVFRAGILVSPERLPRVFGWMLLTLYVVTTVVIYQV